MANSAGKDLNNQIAVWRQNLSRSEAFSPDNIEELEVNLRDSIAFLQSKGLAPDEAFLIASRRMGGPDVLNAEYRKVNGRAIWRSRLCLIVFGLIAEQLCGAFSNFTMVAAAALGRNSPLVSSWLGLENPLPDDWCDWEGVAVSATATTIAFFGIWRGFSRYTNSESARKFANDPVRLIISYAMICASIWILYIVAADIRAGSLAGRQPSVVMRFGPVISHYLSLIALLAGAAFAVRSRSKSRMVILSRD